LLRVLLPALAGAALFLLPAAAYAQVGTISGVVRDASGAVLPGVTVEASSPALIEKVRSTETDSNGRYTLPALSVGTYSIKFTLSGFAGVTRNDVLVTSDATANVVAELKVGNVTDVVEVSAEAPMVNTTTAQVQHVLAGKEIADLPTQRDIPSLLNLVPGFQSSSLRGTCNGGVGTFCNPTVPLFNAHTSALDTDGQDQGRIMVDGMSINMGRSGTGINENVGQANGIVLNTAAAQEVSFTLSGALGESETGGASINIVPQTGGNRFSGGYAMTYSQVKFFDRNTGTRLTWNPTVGNNVLPARNAFVDDYDMTGTFGGPIVKDRLWFFLQGRMQRREQWPGGGQPGYLNANEGIFAKQYQPLRDCSSLPGSCKDGALTYTNQYQNASARLTLQATQRDKFNIYWDEQDSCTNPCYGMISTINSPESYFTLMSRPNRLMQLSWTNPFTNKLLLEAGMTAVLTHQDQTKSREFTNYINIPRICENGVTVGLDEVSTRVQTGTGNYNGGAGTCNIFGSFNSGSINDAFPGTNGGGTNTLIKDKNFRSRASASYITGSHNAKIGWEGAYFTETTRNAVNDSRLSYHYGTPIITGATWNTATRSGNCKLADPVTDPYACGNNSLYYPEDPTNLTRRTIPVGVDINTGSGVLDERVWFGALYLQDQWTLNRFTINGALRYDHAESRYGATCIGPDVYVPTQWCSEPQEGVSYNDLTPRWGVAWDVFGTGRTSVKWNMGKYLQAAGFGGLYTGYNDARRSVNQLTRGWQDLDGDRIFECDMTNFNAHYTNPSNQNAGDWCAGLTGAGGGPSTTFANFGRAPNSTALANATAPCGFTEPHATATQVAYCNAAGQNLMEGWGKRRNEWQFGLGVQHELLPRLSAELTYNRRKYGNLTDTETVNLGCDYFRPEGSTALPQEACVDNWSNYTDPTGLRDFYSIVAPVDSRLPEGGGFTVLGLTTQHSTAALPTGAGNVVLVREDLGYSWQGFDTNFVLRARGGLRLSGGTSTGKTTRETCTVDIDNPNVQGRVGAEYRRGCKTREPLLTQVRGNASYTIPWIDVLAGLVFQMRPGVERNVNLQDVPVEAATFGPGSADHSAAVGGFFPTPPFPGPSTPTLAQDIQILNNRDMYGEALRLFDLTLRKNIRFYGKRLSIGVDVYNLFNSDAPTAYQSEYTAQWDNVNKTWTAAPFNDWGRVTQITNPRFARFSMDLQF
jgi:hypothetical protein